MKNLPLTPRVLSLAMLSLALGACGGGGGGVGGSPAPVSSTISGSASKGTLKNAVVTAYKVTADGKKGDKLGDTRTDNKGVYSLTVSGYTGPVLLEMTTDAASRMTCDIPAGCGGSSRFGDDVAVAMTLSSVLSNVQGGAVTSAITPFTHLAARRALANGLTKAEIEKDLTQVAAIFNLSDLNATQPADVTTASTAAASLDAQRYALLNAAIGQLAGAPGGVNAKLDQLEAQIEAHNGQLVNMSTGGAVVDLEDVLTAAKTVATSTEAVGNLGPLVSTVVSEDLQTAIGKGGAITTAAGTPLAGADDIAKVKAFAQSAHDLASSLRSADTGFLSRLNAKYTPVTDIIDNARNSDEMDKLPDALHASLAAAGEAAANALDNLPAKTPQQLLDSAFNVGSGLNGVSASAKAGTLTVTVANNTVTLNGTIIISKSGTDFNCDMSGCGLVSTPIGAPQTFTLKNVKVQYLDPATVQSSYTAMLLQGASLSGAKTRLTVGADSAVTFKYATADTLTHRSTALKAAGANPAENLLPDSVAINLTQVTLSLTDTTASFTGSLMIGMNRLRLPLTADSTQTRAMILPGQISLSGAFAGLDGDAVNASLTLTLDTASNPQVSPAAGYVSPNVFTYSYNGKDTASLVVNPALAPDSHAWMPAIRRYDFHLGIGTCFGGSNELYFDSDTDGFIGCTLRTTVPAALEEVAFQNDGRVGAWVALQGHYLPVIPAGFDFAAKTPVALSGLLKSPWEGFGTDATHFASGSLSLQMAATVSVGGVTQNAQIRLDAARNGFQGGTRTLTLTANGKTLKLSAPVVGGKASYTLSDVNNVSVDVTPGLTNQTLLLMLNGKQVGSIYNLGGLPVARFADNTVMSL